MLLFAENFDGYGTSTTGRANMLLGTWAAFGGSNIHPLTTNPRGLGTAHLRTSGVGDNDARVVVPGGGKSRLFVGAAVYMSQLPGFNSGIILFQFRDTSNAAMCSVTVTTTGKIELRRGNRSGTVVADSDALSPTPPLTASAYKFVEVFVDIGNGASPADGAVEVRVDGVTVIDADTIDNNNTANALCESIAICGNTTGISTVLDMADFYICDESGSNNNDFLGDTQWFDLVPDADTATTDWTRNAGSNDYEAIDDSVQDGDSTYIAATAAAEVSRFGLGDLPGAASTVVAVVTKVMARKTDAGAANLQVSIRGTEGSPDADSDGSDRPITEAYTYYRDTFETDPSTGVAWTPAGVNAAQVAVEKTV